MDRAELKQKIKEIVAEETEIPAEDIKDEMTMEELEIDSLSITAVLADLYDMGIEVDVDKVFSSKENYTVGTLIERIIDSIAER